MCFQNECEVDEFVPNRAVLRKVMASARSLFRSRWVTKFPFCLKPSRTSFSRVVGFPHALFAEKGRPCRISYDIVAKSLLCTPRPPPRASVGTNPCSDHPVPLQPSYQLSPLSESVLSGFFVLVTPLIYIHFCVWLGLFVHRWCKEMWYALFFLVFLCWFVIR